MDAGKGFAKLPAAACMLCNNLACQMPARPTGEHMLILHCVLPEKEACFGLCILYLWDLVELTAQPHSVTLS